MKGERNLPLCVSQMDVGIVAVAWVAGTGTIGKTSVQSLLQSLSAGLHTSLLIWPAWKWANAQERQRKPQPAEPLSYLWQNRNQKCIIQIYFGMSSLNSSSLSLPWDNTLAQNMGSQTFFLVQRQIEKCIPLPWGVKLIKTCYYGCHMETCL